nr:hypothetical protein [Mesorhizobium ciceri]
MDLEGKATLGPSVTEPGRRASGRHRDGGRGMSAVQDGEGGMTSHQVFSNPVKFLQAYAWRLSLKKPLFSCGRLEGSDRSVLAAVSGQAFVNHSDCFKSGWLAHDWPRLLKRCLSVGYRRDHHRLVIQVNCNRNKRRHFYRSPGLKVAKREGMAVVA